MALKLDDHSKSAVVALIYTAVMLTVLEYLFFPPRIESWLRGQSISSMYSPSLQAGIIWGFACFVGYLLIPALIVKFWSKKNLKDIGFSLKDFFPHLKIYFGLFAIMAPVIYVASTMPDFQNTYPFVREATQSPTKFLIWELFYILQFISLEAFFRGYLIFTLEKVTAPFVSVCIMVVPYTMIHFHKPFLECLGAVIAGLFLGVLALRYRTWAGGALLHSLVAISMDVLATFK